jgi:hypothetical protein
MNEFFGKATDFPGYLRRIIQRINQESFSSKSRMIVECGATGDGAGEQNGKRLQKIVEDDHTAMQPCYPLCVKNLST